MTDTPQGSAAAMLARTKRTEIQHFADGGSVRRTTVRNFAKPSGAAATLAQMPASHAGAKSIEHGGPVRGPGGPTSDAVPLWGSDGEFMLPADTTAIVGKEKLEALVEATHKPTNKAAEKMGRLARADGGEIEDPRKKAEADAAARLAGTNGRASVMAALAPAAAPVPTAQPAAPAMNALPVASSAAPVEQAQVRRVDNAIAAAPTAVPAASPAQTPAAVAAPARVQMATPPAAAAASERPNPLGGAADTNAQLATLQASNAAVPQGGATIIDNAASEADRRAQFNEQANLGNALARTSWSPRRGTQVNDAAVAAAMAPIDARARMSQIAAKEAGDTQRAGIQERGADARARLADTRAQQALGVDQQRLALDSKRVTLDANRDDRAAAAAEVEQAQKARTAKLQDLVLNGTPAQQKMATGQLAALQGREVSGNAPPANYRWSADGTRAEPIPGGPADPAIKANKALTEDQAKSAGYAIRMEDALKTIGEIAKTNPGATRPGVSTAAINMLPEGIANALRPEDRQRVEAAQLDALDAALTLATGAAYTKEQLHGLSRSYFAQPNDGDTTVAEKQARLNKIIETARLRAGPTGSAMADQIARTAGAPTAPPTAAVTSPADHANLPAGATYIAPDGSTRRKQ